MRKTLLVLIFCLVAGLSWSMDISFSTMFNHETVTANGIGGLNNRTISDLASVGFILDVPFNESYGFFMEDSVKFVDVPLSKTVGAYNKNIYWDGNLDCVFHFFGYESFLDPYLTYGIGSSGGVYFDDRANDPRTKTSLVIFPSVGVGGNLNLHGLLIGTNFRLVIVSFNPTPLTTHEQFPLAWTLSVGARL